ncbi:mannose-6-phosphate isomerase, class I [Flaviaesturariibacter amylovorans]|uniref:mannose-6-phosphate isomerase n=1 Tax=Flaviaesturariibacter amylovorans TaxID=1084520 RepID=A0ABP8H0W6_9BACT
MSTQQFQQRVFPIKGVVQHYTWGGFGFLPRLLADPNPEGKPFAEYWLGAHPNCPSTLADGGRCLDAVLSENPDVLLGAGTHARFGHLPFLLKLLDVRQMLSIQVHPNKQEAAAGFARENAAGIPLKAPHRNYRDDNHKPEIMIALSEFWLLHGFKPEAELRATLRSVPELASLLPLFERGLYQGLYEHVMHLDQGEVDRRLRPLAERIGPLYRRGALDKASPDFWAARALETFPGNGSIDRGLFSIYFFNLLRLSPGEGIFQDAGLPHAYLEGQNVELMANSDNVLRAGLTDKHMDVPELLRLVRFEATQPNILRPAEPPCATYPAPVPEFAIEACRLQAGTVRAASFPTASILVVTEGGGSATDGTDTWALEPATALYAAPGAALQLSATEELQFFTARVPGV